MDGFLQMTWEFPVPHCHSLADMSTAPGVQLSAVRNLLFAIALRIGQVVSGL
jgi:hypothetical protein